MHAQVAHLHGVPFLALKSITDIVDGDRPPQEEFLENLHRAAQALQARAVPPSRRRPAAIRAVPVSMRFLHATLMHEAKGSVFSCGGTACTHLRCLWPCVRDLPVWR